MGAATLELRGDELDKPSRAMVVADIYEALTADRPYRAGMPVEKALAILEQERGDKLDGDAIDAWRRRCRGASETGAL
jgi:HD-GYP domain-containing protein (c-di-GMP phosphodiesterase class II)